MRWIEVTDQILFKQAVEGGATSFSIKHCLAPRLTGIFMEVVEDVEWCSENQPFVFMVLRCLEKGNKAKELGEKIYKTGTVLELVQANKPLCLRAALGKQNVNIDEIAEKVQFEALTVLLEELPEEDAVKLFSKYLNMKGCFGIPGDLLKKFIPKIEVDLKKFYNEDKLWVYQCMSEEQKTLEVRLMILKDLILSFNDEKASALADSLLGDEALRFIAQDTIMSEFMCTHKNVKRRCESRDVTLLPFLSPEGIYEVVTTLPEDQLPDVSKKGVFADWKPLELAVLAWKEPERAKKMKNLLHYSTVVPFVINMEHLDLDKRLLVYKRMRRCQLETMDIQLSQIKDYVSEKRFKEADEILEKMLERPQEAIDLILEDGVLAYYLMEGREEMLSKHIKKENSATFLPFLTPSEVAQVNVDEGNRDGTYDGFTGDTVERLERFVGVQFVGGNFLRSFSPLEMAFVAKHHPKVLEPYLPHLEDFHLTSVVPFLPIDLIAEGMIRYATEEQKLILFERIDFAGKSRHELIRLVASIGTVDTEEGPYTRTKEPISERFQRRLTREYTRALQKLDKKKDVVNYEEYPEGFEDSLLGGLFELPYRLPDGNHVDAKYIQQVGGFEKYFFINPFSRKPVELSDCVLDLRLREQIQEYILSRNTI